MTRKILFLAALLGCIAVGAAIAGAVYEKPARLAEPIAADYRPASGTDSAEGVARPNGGPPWTVLTYRSSSGKSCAAVGQLVNGRVGQKSALDGKFREFDKSGAPACVDYSELGADWTMSPSVSGVADVEGGNVTIAWGVVDRSTVREVRVRLGDGDEQVLRPTGRGAFITAFPEFPVREEITVTAVRKDGSTMGRTFPADVPSREELLERVREYEQSRSNHP